MENEKYKCNETPQNPLVSIITPAYNSEKFIGQTIQSVLNQTYTNWEHIIIDDGSTDATAKIIREYQSKDSRIKYVYQKNQRQATARNTGLQHARGALVAFLDHDDLWLPGKLAMSTDVFMQSGCDLLFTDSYIFEREEELKNTDTLQTMKVENRTYSGKDGFSSFLYANKIPMLTVLAKKDMLISVGGFQDYRIADDYLMWLNLLLAGYTLKGIDIPLSAYRLHPQATSAGDRHGIKDVLKIIREIQLRHPDATDYLPVIKSRLYTFVRSIMQNKREMPYLKEQLKYWNLYKGNIRLLILLAPLFPFGSLKRKISRRLR